jgi:hypothetical protein
VAARSVSLDSSNHRQLKCLALVLLILEGVRKSQAIRSGFGEKRSFERRDPSADIALSFPLACLPGAPNNPWRITAESQIATGYADFTDLDSSPNGHPFRVI